MSVQRLGAKKLRKLAGIVGEPVKLGWANGGYRYWFATEGHQHGWYDVKTGEWGWNDPADRYYHLSSCYTEEWPLETRAVRQPWSSHFAPTVSGEHR